MGIILIITPFAKKCFLLLLLLLNWYNPDNTKIVATIRKAEKIMNFFLAPTLKMQDPYATFELSEQG